MDYLELLKEHLNFVERFYDATAGPLEARKSKIDLGEEPFAPRRSPEDYDEPEYLSEWQEADEFIRVLGQSALGLLQKALQDYLRSFLKREGLTLKNQKGSSWLNCCKLLESKTNFKWEDAPVKFEQLELINLTRNAFAHDEALGELRPTQDPSHFRKYPTTPFAAEYEVAYFSAAGEPNDDPRHLEVTRKVLYEHIEHVRQFCSFVETFRFTAKSDTLSRPTLTSIAAHLYVRDLKASTDFFTNKLGFTLDFIYGDPPFYAQVHRDKALLALRSMDEPVFASDVREREDLLSATITLASADEIVQLFAEYQAADVPIHQPLRTEPWQAQTFIIQDPDGNLILFAAPAN